MKRSWLYLGGILVLLITATFVVLRQPGERSVSTSGGNTLATYDSSAIDKIDIRTPQTHVVLEKLGGKWMVTSPRNFSADESSVAAAVGKGKAIELMGEPVSTNPEKQGVFQVDSAGTLVKLFIKGNQAAAFTVGKPTSTYMENYVRLEGSNDVYLAQGMLGYVFNRGLKEWRDKTILKTDESKIANVTFRYGDTTFTLALTDSLWKLDGDSTVQSSVRGVVSSLSNFQTDDFIDTALTDMPKLAAAIDVAGTQIRLYTHKDPGKYYVQTSTSPQWFEIQGWRAQQVMKRKKDFLPVATK